MSLLHVTPIQDSKYDYVGADFQEFMYVTKYDYADADFQEFMDATAYDFADAGFLKLYVRLYCS